MKKAGETEIAEATNEATNLDVAIEETIREEAARDLVLQSPFNDPRARYLLKTMHFRGTREHSHK
jgi:hypothetical protein